MNTLELVVIALLALLCVIIVRCAALRAYRGGLRTYRLQAGRAWVVPSYDDEGNPVRVLRVGGANQSATRLDEHYAEPVGSYIRNFDLIFQARVPVGNVLMLGGGGYSYPKHLVAAYPEARIDVVEIDPMVTAVARRWFYLDRLIAEYGTEENGRLGLIEGDALGYLRTCAVHYDAILNDTFAGREPARDLMTRDACALIHSCLVPGGLYVTNVIAALEGPDSSLLRELYGTCAEVFAHVYVVPCFRSDARRIDNKLLVACDMVLELPGAVALPR